MATTLIQNRKNKLKWLVVSTIPLLSVITAFGLIPQNNIPESFNSIQMVLLSSEPHISSATWYFWHTTHMKTGDTIADILLRLQIFDTASSTYLLT